MANLEQINARQGGEEGEEKKENSKKKAGAKKKSLPLKPIEEEEKKPIWEKKGYNSYIEYLLGEAFNIPEKSDNSVENKTINTINPLEFNPQYIIEWILI